MATDSAMERETVPCLANVSILNFAFISCILFLVCYDYRSFKVTKVITAKRMLTIKKRITILGSEMPFFW